MIYYKTTEEIEKLRACNQLVSRTLAEIARLIRPGITTNEIDRVAEEYIRDHNATPAFLGFNGFPKSICTSVNSQVVHGIPSDYALQEGDILSVDCGVVLDGYVGDSAYSYAVGEISRENKDLLRVTKEALLLGVENAVTGNRMGDIGYHIQNYCEKHGYGVVRELVGHGLGKNLHEEPEVPNYGRRGTGMKLKKGLVICIEPMINMGKRHIVQESDGWTIRTTDKKTSAHFELAVAVDDEKPDILSTFEYVEEVLNQ
jgi:methionyl aminopeptidase